MERNSELERGRRAYANRAWKDAYQALSLADGETPLGTDDLWRLAMAAGLVGRDEDFRIALERAHRLHLEADQTVRAARCAFWVGLRLAAAGEMGPASGWFGRAGRLLAREGRDCVEQGYLLVPVTMQHLSTGAYQDAAATAGSAVEVGERFGDGDLIALGLHLQGRALLFQERIDDGLRLLDEAMVAVATGELSPPITGLIYCSVIGDCRRVFAVRRAHEWTAKLTEWCERQPEMVAFTGECLVYRAEIMQLRGAWREAIEEARRARERFREEDDPRASAPAHYRLGELHRLRGELDEAEEAYRNASRLGLEPQPGLALLRLAQGNTAAAAAAIGRALGEAGSRMRRALLLPAHVEVVLALGDPEEARRASAELDEIAEALGAGVLHTIAVQARGAVDLAVGEPRAALTSLRRACEGWQELEAPYEVARVRFLLGLACRALGDRDSAALELEAARESFEALGAEPDLARLRGVAPAGDSGPAHDLTPRELQVLRILCSGKTNRAIAAELFISERTVDRHVSNILAKLEVPSRSAATAFAYEHDLV